jgi:hypothetical protein
MLEGQYNKMRAIDQILNQMRQRYPTYAFNLKDSPNNGFLELSVLDLQEDSLMVIEFKENQEPVVLLLMQNDGFERRECGAIMDELLELF